MKVLASQPMGSAGPSCTQQRRRREARSPSATRPGPRAGSDPRPADTQGRASRKGHKVEEV